MMTGAPPRIPVGCGAFVSFHPSLGSATATSADRAARTCRRTSRFRACRARAGRTSSARSTPRSSSPTIRTATSFRVRDVTLPAGLTDDRFIGRRDLRKLVDQLPRFAEAAAGDPVAAVDTYYRSKATT